MNYSTIGLKELASHIYETLEKNGIDSVLVGGACVSIYSHNRYQSYDLDFVSYHELKQIEKVLNGLGFKRKGRCFSHQECPYIIDFVNPPIAIGHEPIKKFEKLTSHNGSLKLLTPTDCVKDRLAAFFYWNDEQSLELACLVSNEYPVDLKEVKRWSEIENHLNKYDIFEKKLKSSSI